MDAEGVKLAFCPVLWRANGGPVTSQGTPIVEQVDYEDGKNARGYCTRPSDCYTCELLQNELAHVPEDERLWVCSDCAKDLVRLARDLEVKLWLPGFFCEGQCQAITCERPSRAEPGQEIQARHSIILQLLLGPAHFVAVDLEGK